MTRSTRVALAILAAGCVVGAVLPSSALASDSDTSCIAQATESLAGVAEVAQLDDVIAQACAASAEAMQTEAARQGFTAPAVPMLTWANVGVQADGAVAGFPVVAVCQVGLAFVNPNSTQWVMGAAAASLGPATLTTVNCGGYGMNAVGESVLPVAAAADTAVGPLVAGSLCVVGRGWFIGQATATTTRNPSGCTPDLTLAS